MKVLLIYSLDNIHSACKPLRTWSSMQFGISYISSLLKEHGHQTSLLVLGSNYYKDSMKLLTKYMAEFNPGLICFTAVYSQYSFIENTARFVKKHWPDKYLVMGGVHATLQPEEVTFGPFDAVCVGEGEYPMLELCNQLESLRQPSGIENLWIKFPKGCIEKNQPREFLQDLDILPFPDLEMWKPWMNVRDDDEMTILAGRGCPYDCTYCSNHALRKVTKGQYVRIRSPENILKEVVYLYHCFPHRRISFEIETLDCNSRWTIELCSRLKSFNASIPDPISFASNYRISPHTIDENLFSALEKANFNTINIGLESGSERIRQLVLKRHYTNDDFLKVVSLARKHGLKIFVYNMIGLPGESLNDHKETVQLNRKCQPDGHHTGIFYPYPGTELYNICIQQGLIQKAPIVQLERRQPVIDLPNFPSAKIKSAYTWFNYHIYKGHRPLWELLAQVIQVKISSSPMIKLLIHKIVQFFQLVYHQNKNPV
jgi:anaerobic magnesium-protoporphyrin IX monomethyl ester cyclase